MKQKIIMASQWGVQIEGNDYDLDNIQEKINGSLRDENSFFISKINNALVLRTLRWDRYDDQDTVREVAQRDLATINACISILDGCQKLGIGTLYFFKPGGGIVMSRSSEVNVYFSKPKDKRELPNRFLEVLCHSAQDVQIDNVLMYLTGSPDWIELYKAIEALEQILGGERQLVKYADAFEINVKNIKINANYHRHINRYTPPVRKLYKLEALLQLRKIANSLLPITPESNDNSPPPFEQEFTIPMLEYDNPEDAYLKRISDNPITSFNNDGVAEVAVDVSGIHQLKGV